MADMKDQKFVSGNSIIDHIRITEDRLAAVARFIQRNANLRKCRQSFDADLIEASTFVVADGFRSLK